MALSPSQRKIKWQNNGQENKTIKESIICIDTSTLELFAATRITEPFMYPPLELTWINSSSNCSKDYSFMCILQLESCTGMVIIIHRPTNYIDYVKTIKHLIWLLTLSETMNKHGNI